MLNIGYKKVEKSAEQVEHDKVVARRREICAGCPEKKTTAGIEHCGVCRCIIRGKTSLRGASCPIKKW